MKKEHWSCKKCGNVLAGHLDGDNFITHGINGQKFKIEIRAARLNAVCKRCGCENIYDREEKYEDERIKDQIMETFDSYEDRY